MKFVEFAKKRGKQCRDDIGISSVDLQARIHQHLWTKHSVELCPVDAKSIDGSKAEVHPDQNLLFYDKQLLNSPDELLWYIAHEMGHLELHAHRIKSCENPDPVYGSIYGSGGADSLARYNARSREEVEANAFAAEFLCPSGEAFRLWQSNSKSTVKEIAESFGAPVFVVYSQLAEGLYQSAFSLPQEGVETKSSDKPCSPIQEEAATFDSRPAIIDAGPGTGKTKTLVRRIEHLLSDKKATPEELLVLTFSNDAVGELHDRIAQKFGDEITARLSITTFHGFGLSVLQHHGQFQDIDANARLLDEAGQIQLATELIGKVECGNILKLYDVEETAVEIVQHIAYLKQRLITPAIFEEILDDWIPRDEQERTHKIKAAEFHLIFDEYEKANVRNQQIDFADLILMSINIFRANADLKARYRQKYRWVVVDEYQDVSRATAKLLQEICGEHNPPWVVGDKRQSIYAFCGAAAENVDEFENDFPNAKTFSLTDNYRSCSEVVQTANRMAGLMFGDLISSPSAGDGPWQAHPSNPQGGTTPVISMSIADSDSAEYEGIAQQVHTWHAEGTPLSDIAVLSRRNVDVRDVVLALSKRGIPAIASGIVTADGAAGDLACILTFADKPNASVARLAFALGRNRYDTSIINETIKSIYANPDFFRNGHKWEMSDGLEHELIGAYNTVREVQFTADGFFTICNFLFEDGAYLRRLLSTDEDATRSLAVGEIISTLMRAAAYRFAHADEVPNQAKKHFAQSFRKSLGNSNIPSLSPPTQRNIPAVKVMTCHASKGLEFPFVLVTGQAHSPRLEKIQYDWIPPKALPNSKENSNQSDSVLFVGATRAKQALVVSYAASATGSAMGEKRIVTSLLRSWQARFHPPVTTWSQGHQPAETVDVNPLWGGDGIRMPIAAKKLDEDKCSTNLYLNDVLRLDFPIVQRGLYPAFFSITRKVMAEIAGRAFAKHAVIDSEEALQLLNAEWEGSVDAEHVHHDLFRKLAGRFIAAFAERLPIGVGHETFLDPIFVANENQILLDLVCAYQNGTQPPTALLFRPERIKPKLREGRLLWSALSKSKRVSFALLKMPNPRLRALVFSGFDGQFYEYQWSTGKGGCDEEAGRLVSKAQMLVANNFQTKISEYRCNRCSNRIACPHWLKALN